MRRTEVIHAGGSLITRVTDAIERHVELTVFEHVDAAVDEARIVTVTGRVLEEATLDRLADVIGPVEGVVALHNQVSVLPASSRDRELGLGTARAVYGHPGLWRYGMDGRSSIHVVVEHGRVTLAGTVDSEADRVLAEVAAQAAAARPVANCLRTTE